jgi:hypothetical protein
MPKVFIKKVVASGSQWPEIRSIFVKKTTGWTEVKNVFLKKVVSGVATWVKVFTKASLPDTTTSPTIRTTNSGAGTIYDGPVATSPRYLNNDLFGKDGVYTNFTSKFGRKFTRGSTSSALTRTTIVNDDRFTSAGGVTTAMRTACDEQYLYFELTVQNGSSANEIQSISSPVKMIKNFPLENSSGWSGAEELDTELVFNYNLENFYYNSVEPDSSYIRWWRSTNTDPGGILVKEETITATTTGTPSSTSRTGTSRYTPGVNDLGSYIVAQIIAVNSYTRHFGYTDNYSLSSYPTSVPIAPKLGISNGRVHDDYDNSGLDNRGDLPVGSYANFKATVTGVDSNTTYRVRYRAFNWQNATYYNVSTGATGTASAVWTTFTADGTGSGDISSVIISGSTAELADLLYIDEAYFGSTTYSGGAKRWQLEVEITAIKTGGTRVFLNNPYNFYYLSQGSNSTISVSPTSISPGGSTTISGSFTGFPAGSAYPKQYKVDYGDGTNSGWLPVGGYANGTANPSYSLSKTYSTAGTYEAAVTTIPYYVSNTATTTVSVQPNAFTYTVSNASSVTAPSTPTQTRVSSTSNLVLIDFASSKPTDTDSYTLNISGAGSAAYTTNSNTAVNQSITSVNAYDSTGASSGSGTYEWVTAISSGATTSKAIDLYVVANARARTFNANVSTTTNANSWAINFSWSGASANTVTYYSNGVGTASSATSGTVTVNTDSMPIKIAEITGASNPTITINSITAYGSTGQTGSTRAGTSGTTTSLSSVAKTTSTSGTSSTNYIFYSTDPQEFTINNVTKTDGSATTTPTINTLTYTEDTKRVDFTYSATSAAKYRTLAYGTAYSPDTTGTASPSRGPYPTTGTSDFWSYDEDGSVTVGVAATTAIGSASVTWGASTNAQSYKVSYTLGGTAGVSDVLTTTSFSINTYSSATQQAFVLTGVTAYKNNDGTGTSKAGTMPSTTSVTPTETYSGYGTSSIAVTAFVTPAPTAPNSFLFSRNLNGGTSTTRRTWFWNVSTGIGSRSYVIYDLYWWNQTTEPTTTGTAGSTTFLTFGSSSTSAPVSNANNFNFSGTATPSYRTMGRGSSHPGDNGNTIPTGTASSWAKARCRVVGTNGTTYTSDWTLYR